MKYVPTSVTRAIASQALKAQTNSPKILFVAGIVGVVGTVVLASKATLKLEDTLDHWDEKKTKAEGFAKDKQVVNYGEAELASDLKNIRIKTAVDVVKLYAPAVAVGVLSIAALTKSHNILNERNAALTAAYATLDQAFKQYRKRVVDQEGEFADLKYLHGVSEEPEVVTLENGEKKTTGKIKKGPAGASMYARFFDPLNRKWVPTPEYNKIFLNSKQNYMNDKLHARGYMFLNEVYEELGFESTKAGSQVGWVVGNGDGYIDFGMWDHESPKVREFVNGTEGSILLDFNVDGVIVDLLAHH